MYFHALHCIFTRCFPQASTHLLLPLPVPLLPLGALPDEDVQGRLLGFGRLIVCVCVCFFF